MSQIVSIAREEQMASTQLISATPNDQMFSSTAEQNAASAVVCDITDSPSKPAPECKIADPPSSVIEAVPPQYIAELLKGRDLQTFSLKQVRTELEQKLGYRSGSLSVHPYKERIKELTTSEVERRMAPPAPEVPRTPPTAKPSEFSFTEKRSREEEELRQSGPPKKAQRGPIAGSCPGPLTKRGFVEKAKPLPIECAGHKFEIHQRTFSTGSCGYWGQASIPVMIDGHQVMVKCQINATIPTSKGWVDGN